MSRVFLIGFMGAGKSSVGRSLAARLGRPLVELDREVERAQGATVARIFEHGGEAAFRAAEREALQAACAVPEAVVSCGGGVVLDVRNRELLRTSGTVVLLDVPAEVAVARIGASGSRPLLAEGGEARAHDILAERIALYRATADHVVATAGRSVREVAAAVADVLATREPERIEVHAGGGYDVLTGAGVLDRVGETMAALAPNGRVALVTDTTVGPLLAARVERSLRAAGVASDTFTVPAGETSKTWRQAGALLEDLAAAGLDRGGAVLALGGGVVGDLAGFAAAVYMRGVPVVQLPTTLLAQVDSSIGGKTGVDLAAGKNLAGAFWQPAAVLSDVTALHTLPDAEWGNGMAEAVKTALLAGPDAVRELAADAVLLAGRDEAATSRCVRGCAGFKARVVLADEREAGARECLNLGHTLGHAIEKTAGYGVVPHGVAVAEGLRFAAFLSARLLGAPPDLEERVGDLLDAAGVTRCGLPGDAAVLAAAMRADKKARGGVVRFVLLRRPGEWTVVPVAADVLDAALREWCERAMREERG